MNPTTTESTDIDVPALRRKVAWRILPLVVVLYIIAYNTYGRWLARKIFKLNPDTAKSISESLGRFRNATLTDDVLIESICCDRR